MAYLLALGLIIATVYIVSVIIFETAPVGYEKDGVFRYGIDPDDLPYLSDTDEELPKN